MKKAKKKNDKNKEEENPKKREYQDITDMFNQMPKGKKEKSKEKDKTSNKENSKEKGKKGKDSNKRESIKPKKKKAADLDLDEEVELPKEKPRKVDDTEKESKKVDPVPVINMKNKNSKKKKKEKEQNFEDYTPKGDEEEDQKDETKPKKSSNIIDDEDLDEVYDLVKDSEFNQPKKEEKKKEPKKKTTNKKSKKSTAKKKKSSGGEIAGVLKDYTIVITGQFDLSRDELKNFLLSLGAKVTGSVSSRTNILLHGETLEDGRNYTEGSKYQKAVDLGTTIYSIAEFEDFMKEKTGDSSWTVQSAYNATFSSDDVTDSSIPITNQEPVVPINNNQNEISELWSEKYKPKTMKDIVGNHSQIQKLEDWLNNWDDVVLRGNKRQQTKKGFFRKGQKPEFDNINARACLISGDPGIGKTTTARLIAKKYGYSVYETNASEQRNKNCIKQKSGFLADNFTLGNCFTNEIKTKNLIIMDEIDGLGGNQDRGGIAALIEIIKKTKVPIICIANDRYCQKLKSLVNHCYDLKFARPDKRQVANYLGNICNKEGIRYEINALEILCENCGNDIRQCINFLEMWSKRYTAITIAEITKRYDSYNKDEVNIFTNFQAAGKLLTSGTRKKYNFNQLVDLYFIDYDLIPLLIHENYMNAFINKKIPESKKHLRNLAQEAEYISFSDVIDKRIRSEQEWSLLADKGIFGAVSCACFCTGFVAYPTFPSYMGKLSTLKKTKREIIELKRGFRGCSKEAMTGEIAPIIFHTIINNLEDNENIDSCIDVMKKYRFTNEQFKENILDLAGEKCKETFESLGASLKTKFTKQCNKQFKSSVPTRKKLKVKGASEKISGHGKYDEEGNLIYEEDSVTETINDEEEEEESSSISSKKTKKPRKTKKSKKSETITEEGEGEEEEIDTKKAKKGKKGKKGKKTKKSKKDDDSFIDDE